MEVWFIILISLCACFSLKSLFSFFSSSKTTKKNVSQGNLPPGPPTLPFIGNLHLLPKSMVDLRSLMYDLSHKYGPILTVYLGSEPLIFITSYTLAHQALVRHGATFANRPAVVPVSSVLSNNHKDIGGSPFGPTWKALRRNLISEVLHPTSLKSYSVERKRVLDSLIKGFHESSKLNQPVRLLDHIHPALFSLFIRMTFGELSETQIKEVEGIQYQFLVSYEKFTVLATWPRLGKLLLRNRWKRYLQFLKNQDDVILPLIRARKKLRQERGKAFEQISYIDSLLDLKIPGEKGNVEEADVLSLCSELINAGGDTSTTMLQWVLAYLVKHPRVQSKLFAEISKVVAKGAKEVEEDDLHKIPYLKAVVLETLRIHPPNTLLVPHTPMEDVELGGYTIPKDTKVNIVTALIGRDPNVWENPMEFRPERLLTSEDIGEEVSDVTAFKMMPFGAGRRKCPGNKLGLLLLQYFVSNLVWNFEFKTVDGEGVDLSEKVKFLIVMKNPVRAYISPRIK
ncbi:cytochrome P450 89A2-like [Juglans microcarpa x Juglans regia]|uniref:cytochrome P450 89A2-like n=1 Tax=Juglans microcarpa x Juglans regia TaxID=2249226 RepID=UPI001B7ED79E|nr:cytochrome P450 89A2-like [Juglans microcarpa x Juglans regia]XP_041013396.1 cytochrome P450 89A2-like [Juglans microcarpa x Juglans regia]XP_041013397.1 cytochrome P450 89A2-like [Juglans microcarpa x Juglans regia]